MAYVVALIDDDEWLEFLESSKYADERTASKAEEFLAVMHDIRK